MKALALVGLIYATAVLQVTLGAEVKLGIVQIHFLFLAALVAIFAIDGSLAVVAAAAIGLLADALSPGPLGADMLSLTLVGLLARMGDSPRRSGAGLRRVCLAFVAAVPALCASGLIQAVLSNKPVELWPLVTSATGLALGTALGFGILYAAWRVAAAAGRIVCSPFVARRSADWTTL
jgi:rod shape-determining protein MreD